MEKAVYGKFVRTVYERRKSWQQLSLTLSTKIGYSYNIVHPSNSDIRYIGGDNSSDGIRVLRVDGDNSSGSRSVKVEFGNWSVNQNITYTAAYAIVNEEQFAVNITHINVSVTSGTYSYLQIWLHGNGTLKADDDATSVFMYNNGTVVNSSSTTAWSLAKGNGDASNMNTGGTSIDTTWDETAHVRYSTTKLTAYGVGMSGRTVENASDFVWVQISIVPESASTHTGTISVNFEASTHWDSAGGGGGPQTAIISGTTDVEDSHICKNNANDNYGGSSMISVDRFMAESNRGLIRVKNVASNLGAGATITGCTLNLYCYNQLGGTVSVSAYRVFKPWVEGDEDGVDDNDGDVTWNDWASDASEWGTAGCDNADDGGSDNSGDGTGADRKATAEDTATTDADGQWCSWDISTSLAQGWYDGTINEEGVVLICTANDFTMFYSTESAESEKPYWEFTFTT